MLAELKSFHQKALDEKTDGARNLIPQIPPPPWTPAVLQGDECSPVAGHLQDGDAGADASGSDDAAPAEGSTLARLNAIEQAVSHSSRSRRGKQSKTSVSEYIAAIKTIANADDGGLESMEPPRKKARGNFGFFKHLRDQRAQIPRRQSESSRAYEKRLREHARDSWKESWSLRLRHCFLGSE